MNRISYIAAIVALLAATGCRTLENDPISPSFGSAVRQNMAAHIINPDPVYDPAVIPETDGARAQSAVERYRAGEVIAPEEVLTSDVGESN